MLKKNEEVYDIKSDTLSGVPNVAGRGVAAGYDMEKSKIGAPCVRFDDSIRGGRLIWPDVYAMDKHLMVIWRCPRCTGDSNIRSDRKRIDYTPGSNKISIAPFGCLHDGCGLKLEVRDSVAREHKGPL